MDKDLYFQLRQEIMREMDQSSKTKGWSIALAGASMITIFGILVSKPPHEKAIVSDPLLACAGVLVGVGIINILFVLISWQQSRGIIRMAAFMYALEERLEFTMGWEHFVFQREHKKCDLLLTNIPFFVQLGVAASTTFFSIAGKLPFGYSIFMWVLCVFSVSLRLSLPSYRSRALKAMQQTPMT